jgi:hypothetical protein
LTKKPKEPEEVFANDRETKRGREKGDSDRERERVKEGWFVKKRERKRR